MKGHLRFCKRLEYNSGPYGGMLSLCLCTLSPYLFNLYLKKVTKGLVYIVVIPCLLMILFSLSRSAWLAVCVCFVIMYLRKYPKEKKKRISILAFVVFLCGCSYLVKKESADGRFLMNKIAISSIANNNIWGAGIGLYCGSYAESSYEFFKVDKGEAQIESLPKINHEKSRNVAGAPFDAFNEYLRAGVELGVPGLLILLLVSGLSLYVLFSINSTFRYGLLSLLIFALFSYPFSLPVFQVFFVFFLAIASTSAKKLLNGKSALFLGILLLLTSGLSFFKSYPYYRNISRCEKEWKEYDELYNLGFFSTVNDSYFTIHHNLMHNADFLFKYGKSLQKEQRYAESSKVFIEGSKISSDPIFWNELGNNYLSEGYYDIAEKCYTRAFYILPNRIYPLYYLCKLYYKKGDIDKFTFLGNIVKEFNPKIESNTVNYLKEEIIGLSPYSHIQ